MKLSDYFTEVNDNNTDPDSVETEVVFVLMSQNQREDTIWASTISSYQLTQSTTEEVLAMVVDNTPSNEEIVLNELAVPNNGWTTSLNPLIFSSSETTSETLLTFDKNHWRDEVCPTGVWKL